MEPTRDLPPVPVESERRDVRAWRRWLASAFQHQPERFAHSAGVSAHAAAVAANPPAWLGQQRAHRLELAALLHDIGRAIDPADREPHGFVGARFLDRIGLHDVAPLVAHHSGARFEALAREMSHLDVWPERDHDLSCVVTYLDRITSHDGRTVTPGQRRVELLRRYRPGSIRVVSFDLAAGDAERGRRLVSAPVEGFHPEYTRR